MSRAANWNEKAKLIYKRLRKKINSKITFTALNKNKKKTFETKKLSGKVKWDEN